MQKALFFLFLVLTTVAKAQNADVLHYKFSLQLNDRNDTLYGLAQIRVLLKENRPLVLDLQGRNQNGKGMLVTKVDSEDPSPTSLPFQQAAEKLTIPFRKTAGKDTVLLRISYKGLPDDGLIISKNKFGERTFFGDNWPNRAHHWLPCVDRPDDKATFEFLVTAPSHYRVVSNGIKVEETDLGNGTTRTHWQESTPLPTKVMVIGAARFAVKTFDSSPAGIPVSAWVYPKDSAKGFFDYALAVDIVRFFSGYIAPFPYEKLANVQSTTIFGGMENASCIFYAENSVTGNRHSEDLLAHEIAHQWFGDMASEKSFAHLWLSEGFATYFTDLYFEKKYGREAMAERLEKEREEVIGFAHKSTHAVVDSTTNLMSLLNANSYQKGAWVLHMLRAEVGDSAFQQIIQTYYNRYKGSNAETRDFEAVAEKVSGKNLKGFFDQWLYSPGLPQLKVKKTSTELGTLFTVSQVQARLFALTLPVQYVLRDGKEARTSLRFTKREESLFIKGGVASFTLDPDSTLLFETVK